LSRALQIFSLTPADNATVAGLRGLKRLTWCASSTTRCTTQPPTPARQQHGAAQQRSKTPGLVQQELWGLLLAHFAIRQLMTQAAWPRRLDPDDLSFVHAVRVIKRKMPQAAAVPP
jgi:hypothetical protein